MESISLSDEEEISVSCEQLPEKTENCIVREEDIKEKCIPDPEKESDTSNTTTNDYAQCYREDQTNLTKSDPTFDCTPTDIMQSKNECSIDTKDKLLNVIDPLNAAINDHSTSPILCNEKSALVQNESTCNFTVEPERVPIIMASDQAKNSPESSENSTGSRVNDNSTGESNGEAISENINENSSRKKDDEIESDKIEMTNKILQMEEERGKLTTEVMEKEILVLKMEKETTSLKSEISQLESTHETKLAEIEKKHKQTLELMNTKMVEVRKLLV